MVRIETENTSGTGVLVSTDDRGNVWILTNNHVIEFAGSIDVTVRETEVHTATFVSSDVPRDLAVIRFCCDMTSEPLIFSSNVRSGASVAALGFPLGSSSLRVSGGIISGVQPNAFRDRTEYQTDAAINPGNSGGPLMLLVSCRTSNIA